LVRDGGDEAEVLVDGEDRQSGFLGGRRDHQIRDGLGAVLATVGQEHLLWKALSSMAGVRYSIGISDSGGRVNSRRPASPERAEYPSSSRG
jgi:hypothetical protein